MRLDVTMHDHDDALDDALDEELEDLHAWDAWMPTVSWERVEALWNHWTTTVHTGTLH